MPSDAHCHPFDLAHKKADAEAMRLALNLSVAASSWNEDEFIYHEALAEQAVKTGGPPIALCFGVHPQLPSSEPGAVQFSLNALYRFAAGGKLAAIGEIGFDLFDEAYKATETIQERLFKEQIGLARQYNLPVVLHVRKAMDKVFSYLRELTALPAVVFHSYAGTYEEALALRKRGVAAYFSFGSPIMLNHRKAMRACALLPQEVLLFETDAPYQSQRGKPFSDYGDLCQVVKWAARLRSEAGTIAHTEQELHATNDENFSRVYFHTSV
ncbi:TatD family hydrolase [Gracilinema caldarium]|uniref:TatD family hydrolase n=1 Tax=Gracilinema caldarium TaxID=215591 RepID=UPI0026EB2825|nr:TatD family hydrolase [Gracilinema caldarium]